MLDEVLGELDESRRKYVLNDFVNSQIFITSCNMKDFADISNTDNMKVWNVDDGEFALSSPWQ